MPDEFTTKRQIESREWHEQHKNNPCYSGHSYVEISRRSHSEDFTESSTWDEDGSERVRNIGGRSWNNVRYKCSICNNETTREEDVTGWGIKRDLFKLKDWWEK